MSPSAATHYFVSNGTPPWGASGAFGVITVNDSDLFNLDAAISEGGGVVAVSDRGTVRVLRRHEGLREIALRDVPVEQARWATLLVEGHWIDDPGSQLGWDGTNVYFDSLGAAQPVNDVTWENGNVYVTVG